MSKSRWLTWLHRLGYVTTAVVVVAAAGVGWLAYNGWREQQAFDRLIMDSSRTHDGPFSPNDQDVTRAAAPGAMAKLPPLSEMAGDGFRFAAMPASGYWYATALWLPAGAAAAEGVVVGADDLETGLKAPPRRFVMPRADYLALVRRLDGLADGWTGYAALCMDGTAVGFERVRGPRVVSAAGNAGCSKRYAEISGLVNDAVQRFAPDAGVPAAADWVPPMRAHPEEPVERPKGAKDAFARM